MEEPAAEEPEVVEEPEAEEPEVAEEPAAEEPEVAEEPVVEEPVVEEPEVVEEPAVEEPAVEEPEVEEPVVEAPVVEEPIVEEPTPPSSGDEDEEIVMLDLLPPDAELVQEILDALDPGRRILLYVSWGGQKAIFGSTAKLIAVPEGYDDVEFTLQWQRSTDNLNWEDVPEAKGYTFDEWVTTEGGNTPFTFGTPINVPTTAYATWTPNTNTSYTVVFWKQQVTDNKNATDAQKKYDFAEAVSGRTAATGASVSPIAADRTKDYTGFHYNAQNSVAVTVKGDGTTVLNVYYDRNLLSIKYYEDQGSFWNPNWVNYRTDTGLYGQTLQANGYTWPTGIIWLENFSGPRLTFWTPSFLMTWEHSNHLPQRHLVVV